MPTPYKSYERHQFPSSIIAHAVWLYVRFNLRLSDADEMLFESGTVVSYETARRCTAQFGPQIARNLWQHQRRPGDIWHLDAAVVLFVSIHSATRKCFSVSAFRRTTQTIRYNRMAALRARKAAASVA